MSQPTATADRNSNSLALGPKLPMSVYTAVEPWHQDRVKALALYCSDGRWGEAFDEFCHRCLHIPRYDRWAVPGGPAWLVPQNQDAAFFETARGQLDFLIKAHELEQVVLITHFGCAVYAERLKREPLDCLRAQIEDVEIARATLAQWYPQLAVKSFLAMRQERALSFHELRP